MADHERYVRVYWSILDDPKFAAVYDDDAALALWLRLLIGADMAYPASAPLPFGTNEKALALLIEVGLVDRQSGSRYRIHGLDAERSKRRGAAQAAAAARWGTPTPDVPDAPAPEAPEPFDAPVVEALDVPDALAMQTHSGSNASRARTETETETETYTETETENTSRASARGVGVVDGEVKDDGGGSPPPLPDPMARWVLPEGHAFEGDSDPLSDPLEAYRVVTGRYPRSIPLQKWLDRLFAEHHGEPLLLAMRAEHAADPTPANLMTRVEERLCRTADNRRRNAKSAALTEREERNRQASEQRRREDEERAVRVAQGLSPEAEAEWRETRERLARMAGVPVADRGKGRPTGLGDVLGKGVH